VNAAQLAAIGEFLAADLDVEPFVREEFLDLLCQEGAFRVGEQDCLDRLESWLQRGGIVRGGRVIGRPGRCWPRQHTRRRSRNGRLIGGAAGSARMTLASAARKTAMSGASASTEPPSAISFE